MFSIIITLIKLLNNAQLPISIICAACTMRNYPFLSYLFPLFNYPIKNIILRLIKFMKNIVHIKQNNELSNITCPNRFKPIFNNVE